LMVITRDFRRESSAASATRSVVCRRSCGPMTDIIRVAATPPPPVEICRSVSRCRTAVRVAERAHRSSGSVPTFHIGLCARSTASPASGGCRSIAGTTRRSVHGAPAAPRAGGPSASGRKASQSSRASSSSPQQLDREETAMSHATHSTGPTPDTTRCRSLPGCRCRAHVGDGTEVGRQVGPRCIGDEQGDSPVTAPTASTTRSRIAPPPELDHPLGCPP